MDIEERVPDDSLFNEFLLHIKDEICGQKELYIDLIKDNGNKFEIKYEQLPERLPFFEIRNDVYQALLQMRKHQHKTLKIANIFFTRGCNPILTIELASMLAYINIKGIVHKPQSTTSSSSNIVTKTRGSSIQKELYHPGTIRNLYKKLNLKQHVNAINMSMVNVTNTAQRSNLLSHLFSNLHSSYNSGTKSRIKNINQFIVTNIISFLKALQGESRGSIPTKHAITKLVVVCAALYGHADGTMPGICEKALSDHLLVSRQLSWILIYCGLDII